MLVRVVVALVDIMLDGLRFDLVQLRPQRLQLTPNRSWYLAIVFQIVSRSIQGEQFNRAHVLN